MKMSVYIMTDDTGFAPNPFWDYLTLACCKPVIREHAILEDWIVGFRGRGLFSKHKSDEAPDEIFKLIYCFQIKEILSFSDYFNDPRFENKRPDFKKTDTKYHVGDNIYEPLDNGQYQQIRSYHSLNKYSDWKVDENNMKRDMSSGKVLISGKNDFWYFGRNPIKLPKELIGDLIMNYPKGGTGHKNIVNDGLINDVIASLPNSKKGVNSNPHTFREYNKSNDPKLKCG